MSVVSRLSMSRASLFRAVQPARTRVAISKAVCPQAVRTFTASAFVGTPVIARKNILSMDRQQSSMFKSFHCTAMAFDAEPAPNTKLYVGNISWNIGDQELKDTFDSYGNVETCEVILDQNGRSRGFAFVTMGSVEEATAAAESLNDQLLDGREMRVNFHTPRDPNAPRPQRADRPPRRQFDSANRLYVGNLPWNFDDFDLQDSFEEFGTIVDAKVITDRETGRSRGFGFVTLSGEDEVEKAISELDGSLVEGRAIRVNKAER